jgi:hypothetical protein
MAPERYSLVARVDTDSPGKVRPVLQTLVGQGTVKRGSGPNEFLVTAEMDGTSAKELNRALLSALRRAEKKTRLRAEWIAPDGATETYFDYVLKRTTKVSKTSLSPQMERQRE